MMDAGFHKDYEAIVIGTSAGGLYALSGIFEILPANYKIPIIVVQHRAKDQRDLLEEILQTKSKIMVKQADEKEKILAGFVYVAPPDYHLLIEADTTFSLNSDVHVRYSRPSIDVLFESAADVYGDKLVAIILTGANNDGSAGMKAVRKRDGLTIAEDPAEADFPLMPKSAIDSGGVLHVWKKDEIGKFLLKINNAVNE